MRDLKVLILRSCNITGELPDYLASMSKLKTLDLSFNRISGAISDAYSGLANVDYMYLTGNMITGAIPEWMLKTAENVDLSYNNLMLDKPQISGCQERSLNLFKGFSALHNSESAVCLRESQCPRYWYSFHINCGGKQVILDNTTFEDDVDSGGPSKYFQGRTNWVFSSTGNFMDDDRQSDSYIATNMSKLEMPNLELYKTARISPISLTYYGFCLLNGNYTINLHFAEIMFTNTRTYTSLGRRVFNVYIQGQLVLENFNIDNEAGGAGKVIIKKITAIVFDNTLEIQLRWTGRGTTAIPVRSVYGPLISAISVNPDFTPPEKHKMSANGIAGIVTPILFLIVLIIFVMWWKFFHARRTLDPDLREIDLMSGVFTLRHLKAATNNFDPANKLGEGGFGSVYKGILVDGTVIAVKQLSAKSKQGNREFINEIGMISAVQHPHLVKLYGCCIEGNQLHLIYEYMENNSLARALYGPEKYKLKLDWDTRQKICIGIARGLVYLHEESRLKIVHRDIKTTNVLLDKDLHAKISDFGLARLDEEDDTHISTRVAGTYGYMAPEYAMHGYLTEKADVYSFGIVTLEIVSGRSNTSLKPREDCFHLLDLAVLLKEKGDMMELVDPRLGTEFNVEQAMRMIKLALLCTNISPSVRPKMSWVVSMLEGKDDLDSNEVSPVERKRYKMEDFLKHNQLHSATDTLTESMSIDGPWSESSPSAAGHILSLGSSN